MIIDQLIRLGVTECTAAVKPSLQNDAEFTDAKTAIRTAPGGRITQSID
jgi:hypothetical protein